MPKWLKNIVRPLYFWIFRMRGYPGLDYLTSPILDVHDEYNQVRTFRIAKPEGFAYDAGQYAHLVAPGGHINMYDVRHMSLASAPHEPDLLFTMDLQSNSRFKRRFRQSKAGDTVGLFKIRGHFTANDLGEDDSILFIAGGIGITPIRSIIQSNPPQQWKLVYAGKGYCYTDEWQDEAVADKVTFVKRHSLFDAIDAAVTSSSHFYICGTGSFIGAVTEHLMAQDVAEERIRTENFGA
ncbi:MAG: FAD-dependent oxidoreductase [Bacteroidota bacterium]